MKSQFVGVRIPADLFERFEAKRGDADRSEYIRSLIEADVGLKPDRPKPAKKPVLHKGPDLSGIPERWRDDARALCEAIRFGPREDRELKDRLGWLSPRLDRVLGLLVDECIVVRSGVRVSLRQE